MTSASRKSRKNNRPYFNIGLVNGIISDMSKSDPKSCNRQPFLSEAGCDRGNVDIHQFDDFPYCEPVNPTMPSIPPEIVDTPIELPVPPSCACVNIKYALNFKYSQDRKFAASASFSAQGDCCEGNYVSNFNLQIPCPILSGGSKKIKMKIGYGTGKASVAASYIKANASSCTVEAKDVDINLNIPCPVKDARGKKIKIGISYGDGEKTASAEFLRTDTRNCEIEALTPTLHINIPCPISGRSDTPKIKASIKYGDGDSKASASYIKADPKACTIEPLSPTINLNIPCPVKDARGKKIKIGISYGNGNKEASASYLRTDTEKCEVEALAPTFKLNLPCPVRNQRNTPKIKAKIGWGMQGASASASLLSVNVASCEIQARDVNLSLNLPCPVRKDDNPPKIKAKIKWGNSGQSASASFLTADPDSCQIRGTDAVLNLNLPCPIRNNDTPPKLKAKIDWGDTGKSASVSILTANPESCEIKASSATLTLRIPCPIKANATRYLRITPKIGNLTGTQQNIAFATLSKTNCELTMNDTTFNLNVPCPVTAGTKTFKINALQFGVPTAVTKNLATLTNCNVDMQSPEFSLNVPCALQNIEVKKGTVTTEGSVGTFSITDTGKPAHGSCSRTFTIDVKFPKGGGDLDLDKELVIGVRYNASRHALQIKTYNPKKKTESDWKDVFSAVSHKSDHVNCNDV